MTDDEWAELPVVLRVPTVSAVLECSNDSTYRLIKLGLLPGLRIGRSLRVSKAALLDFIATGGLTSRPTPVASTGRDGPAASGVA